MTALKKITLAVEPGVHKRIKEYAVSKNISIKELVLKKLFEEIEVNNEFSDKTSSENHHGGLTRYLTDEIVEKINTGIINEKLQRGENVILGDEMGIYYLQKDGSKKYIED